MLNVILSNDTKLNDYTYLSNEFSSGGLITSCGGGTCTSAPGTTKLLSVLNVIHIYY